MITQVRDKVMEFLKETIEAEGIRVITIEKEDGGWIAEAEVAEMNQYLASVNPDYHVFEKEHYIVRLGKNLEVASYKRVNSSEEEL